MDKNKIIEAAAKLVAKGAYDKAIKEYQKILSADPRDTRALQKLGELYQKKNDNAQAAQFFTKVAESYSEEGFFLKAVALYKQVLKLSPGLLGINLKLAELHQQLQLMSEAASYYQLVASQYEQAGDVRASLNIFKKLVDLSPENVTSRVKLAELYVRESMKTEAAEEFRRAIQYLQKHKRQDDVQRVMERLATLEPNNLQLARELAGVYLALGDAKRALAKLQVCFNADPKDVETLVLLAGAFQDIGQTGKAVSIYKEMVKLFTERNQPSEANKIRAKIQQLEPTDAAPAGAESSTGSPLPGTPVSVRVTTGPVPVTQNEPSGGDPFARVLTETDVYLKYGLHDRALEHLGKIFAIDPENLDAHEKAYLVYEASNNPAQALEQLLNVLRLCTRLEAVERGRPYLAKLLERSPDHAELPVFISVLGQPEEAIEPEQVAELTDEQIVLEPDDAPPDDELSPETVEAQDLALESLAGSNDQEPSGHHAVDEPSGEHGALNWDEPLSTPPEAEESIEVSVDDALEGSAEEEASLESPETPIEEEIAEPLADDGPVAEEDSAYDELAEAEFFLEQGLLGEARETLETVLIVYPEHAGAQALVARLAELEASQSYADEPDSAASDEVAAPAGRKPAGGDDFQYSAEDVLAEFKKGLENVVQPHDVETHYDLGIAYKEMGLIDEAIAEFNIARQGCVDQKKEIDCLTMIALLQQMKGEPFAAIESLKQALACQQVTSDIQKGLEYDLGIAWEKADKPGKALYHYQKASTLDRSYRDVAKVVARLSATCKPESDPAFPRRDSRNGTRSDRDDSGRNAAKADGESPRAAGARPGRVRTAAK